MPNNPSRNDHLAKFIVTAFILGSLICVDIIVTVNGSWGARDRGINIIASQGRIEGKLDTLVDTKVLGNVR